MQIDMGDFVKIIADEFEKEYKEKLDVLKNQASLVDTIREKLKRDYDYYTEKIKIYEDMRRYTTSDFYKQSYQSTIHKFNAKREYIKSNLEILEGN
jgi:hypothetical protein